MKSVNYKSDFKLIEGGCDFSVPFVFEYRTGFGRSYKAGHIDGQYDNCQLLEDGRLMVVFDGICDLWDKRPTGIVLTSGKTEECDPEVQLPPYYQQGEPGKPGESLTWDKMTEEDKEALKASVVKEVEGLLVQVEPVDETEYEDYFNDIKTVNE